MTGPCARTVASCLGLFAASLVASPSGTRVEEAASNARRMAEVRAHQEFGQGLDDRHTLKAYPNGGPG